MDSGVPRTHRRQGRAVALQTLYEADAARHPVGAVLERLSRQEQLEPSVADFARQLVSGVNEHQERIDSYLAEAAPTWPLSQMARVDKAVLRLAIYEAFIDNAAVPARAVINEAIELAKTFGSESSSKFVNGVLATLAERLPKSAVGRSDA